MIPLHRMPIAYIVALGIGLGVLVVSRHRADRPARRVVSASEAVLAATDPGPDVVVVAAGRGAADGIDRAASGVRRKVVVKGLGLRCRSEPGGGGAVGPALDYFSIHFVYGEDRRGGATSYRIGPASGPPIGWVPASAVFEWDTRLMAVPTPDPARLTIDLFGDADAAIAPPSPMGGGGKVVGSEPRRWASGAVAPPLGMPILRSATTTATAPGGGPATAFEVAALVRETLPKPPPTAPPEELRRALRRVDVVLALDATNSMGPAIEAVRRVVDGLADERSPRYAGLELGVGLVVYRDDDPGYPRVTPIGAPAAVRAEMARVEPAKRGDGSIPEAVLDAVAVAIDPGRMGWPTGTIGDASTKLVVLIGDAPDHARDLDRARGLAAEAAGRKITIAAVAIETPLLSRSESAAYRDQWRTLAEASYRPRRRDADGPIAPILPAVGLGPGAGATAVEEIARAIGALIDDRARDALEIARRRAEDYERALRDYVDARSRTLDRLAPVFVDLHRGEDRPAYRPDPRLDGAKAPSVRVGWVAERRGGGGRWGSSS